MNELIFLTHVGATIFLVGLIWTIQIVHYPLFASVGMEDYAAYQNLHMSRITYVVAPVMLTELLTGIYFVFVATGSIDRRYLWFGFALILIIWISTLFVQ